MKSICILGSTGSIGVNTLDVISQHPDQYRVIALTAHHNIELLAQQIQSFTPELAVVASSEKAQELKNKLGPLAQKTQITYGPEQLIVAASLPTVDTVMAAIVGAAGLAPCYAAAKSGKRILLANKEALVMAGDLFMQAVNQSHAILLPIDSEHNAIYQCLPHSKSGNYLNQGVTEIMLTASGGPFRETPLSELSQVTPAQACAHPNWVMGKKISVDSATMMNKALEVIEAHHLFDLPAKAIQVQIHPQSIVHSMVRYIDGSVIAQMGQPDMRIPISYGLAWPDRIPSGSHALDLTQLAPLSFYKVDAQRFPALDLAYQALDRGQSASIVLNAANEVAVEAFLSTKIRFTDIYQLVSRVLDGFTPQKPTDLDTIVQIDHEVRQFTDQQLQRLI